MNLQNHDGGMAEPVRGVNKNTANEATNVHFFHQVSKKEWNLNEIGDSQFV